MTRFFETTLRRSREYLVGAAIGIACASVAALLYIALDPMFDVSSNEDSQQESVQRTDGVSRTDFEAIEQNVAISEELHGLYHPDSVLSTTMALHRRIATSNVEELGSLLKHSSGLTPVHFREQTQEMIGRKLASINPRLALSKIDDLPVEQQTPFIGGGFKEWAYLHLDDAIESANGLEGANKSVATQAILSTRSDLSSSLRREIAQDLGRNVDALVIVSREEVAQAMDDPGLAWSLMVNDDLNDTYQLESLIRVAEAWVERDGVEILSQLYPGDREQYKSSQIVTDKVVAAISEQDPEGAFEYVRSLSGIERYKLSTILATWARTNPDAAVKALAKLELDAADKSIRDNFIKNWVGQDLDGALQVIAILAKPIGLKVAEAAIGVVAQTSPADAIKLLGEIGDIVEDTSSIEKILVEYWAPVDPQAALNWMLEESTSTGSSRFDMMQVVVRELTQVNPVRAFDVALMQPKRELSHGMEADVIRDISLGGNVELAIELMPRVRAESKNSVYASIGSGLVQTEQIERALSFGEELHKSYQSRYFSVVASTWANNNPLKMFEELPRLREDLQSGMAKELVWANKFASVLKDEQLEKVKTFLNEEDAKMVGILEGL